MLQGRGERRRYGSHVIAFLSLLLTSQSLAPEVREENCTLGTEKRPPREEKEQRKRKEKEIEIEKRNSKRERTLEEKKRKRGKKREEIEIQKEEEEEESRKERTREREKETRGGKKEKRKEKMASLESVMTLPEKLCPKSIFELYLLHLLEADDILTAMTEKLNEAMLVAEESNSSLLEEGADESTIQEDREST
ncbi:hypothetical protein Tco_0820397 [Tanacetum coccineum]|uniref:Uncharacterized protein n=1 Tax=Tanacetum coccineum TaxID=301880 RepID=A0ABQ5AAA6_9ASTR